MKTPKGTIQDECFYLNLLGFNSIKIATMVTKNFKLKRPLRSHEVEILIEAENILYAYSSLGEQGTKIMLKKQVTETNKNQQNRFKLLSAETKDIIEKKIDELTDKIIDSIYQQQCEIDSPNSLDFWNNNELLATIAQEYMIATANGEIDV